MIRVFTTLVQIGLAIPAFYVTRVMIREMIADYKENN